MNIKKVLKKWIFNNFYSKTAFWVINNHNVRLHQLIGRPSSFSGATHSRHTLEDSVRYINTVFEEYKQYGEFPSFTGNVLELGPGDNAGVALLMQADGATTVDLVDRFYSARDLQHQSIIYNQLAEISPLIEKKELWNEAQMPGISWHTNDSAEDFLSKLESREPDGGEHSGYYDFIVSRAVLEHVSDPMHVIRQGLKMMKPGGIMVHMIDFRDHGYFSRQHDELSFLRVHRKVYPLMISHCGGPNRVLLNEYKTLLQDISQHSSIDSKILVTNLVGETDPLEPYQAFSDIDPARIRQAVSLVNQQRHQFSEPFQSVSAEDLAVSGICLIITKGS